jgi:hypothetical protein
MGLAGVLMVVPAQPSGLVHAEVELGEDAADAGSDGVFLDVSCRAISAFESPWTICAQPTDVLSCLALSYDPYSFPVRSR